MKRIGGDERPANQRGRRLLPLLCLEGAKTYNLQLHSLLLDLYSFEAEINTDSTDKALRERIILQVRMRRSEVKRQHQNGPAKRASEAVHSITRLRSDVSQDSGKLTANRSNRQLLPTPESPIKTCSRK